MLEKPNLQDETLLTCLQNEYGLSIESIAFLPLGADLNTAVYRAVTQDGTAYFVKLRRGEFNEASVTVPKFLSDQGIREIIPPLTTQTGQLWADLSPFKLILYPFVEGRHGYEKPLSPQQWFEFGTALKRFHKANIPPEITRSIPRERFAPHWRETVKLFLERIEKETFTEPAAAAMAAFLKTKSRETVEMVQRAERFAHSLKEQLPEFILCHADIHGWNLLIDPQDTLYMVDWDTLLFAPKERDLMFIGGGLGNSGYPPEEEETLFYQGYGQPQIHPIALAYYRYERVIEDIAVYCEQIFLSDEGGEDRKEALKHLQSNFLPNGTISRAYQTDQALLSARNL